MRSMWKGSLSFGLVNIPVQMYTASVEKPLSFTLLHKKDLSKIRYARICTAEDKEVPWSEIVKGYEQESGQFVVMEDKDFAKASLKKTQTIDIVGFVDPSEIDTIFYSKPYFLEPQKNADNAYRLLREALKKSDRVGLARYILRNREHLAIVRAHDNILILNELRYEDELVKPEHLKIPANQKVNTKELEVAVKLIDHLAMDFNPRSFKDSYAEDIRRVLKQKGKGHPVRPKEKPLPSPKVHNIIDLLQASLKPKKKVSRKSA